MEILTLCPVCEDFKSDVMFRFDPHYQDEKGQLNMRNMCEECDEALRDPEPFKNDPDALCDICEKYKESTHLRTNLFVEDLYDEDSLSNICDECHAEQLNDI